jgi:hypothetical protein
MKRELYKNTVSWWLSLAGNNFGGRWQRGDPFIMEVVKWRNPDAFDDALESGRQEYIHRTILSKIT